MAKLVFIPDWLRDEICSSGESFSVLDKDLASTIISRADIINYHKAQIEFFNFLTGYKDFSEETHLMYNSLFAHPLPDMPELSVYLRQSHQNDPNLGVMVSGVGEMRQINFVVDTQSDGKSIYIIGTCTDDIPADCADKRHNVITNVLAVMHNRLRVQNGAVDKSSVFRDSPLLTTLYVESIPC